MILDWNVVATIAGPIIALFVGAALNRWLERKPRVIAYYSNVSSFQLQDQARTRFNTHSVVIKNAGKRPAKSVRVTHHHLPDNFNVYPDVEYTRSNLPGGGAELVFPTVVPDEQVSISYLYFPPATYAQVNSFIKHDDGYAKGIVVLPTPKYPKWVDQLAAVLMLFGLIFILYLLFELVRWTVGAGA